jgi:starvation-inducible DNA-binding protein
MAGNPSTPRTTAAARAERDLSRDNELSNPVVVALRKQVANAFVLYANYKRYHWQTFGPHFRDLHKLFDELAVEVLDSIDPLAERIRMIGPDPPRMLEWAELASADQSDTLQTMRQMIEEARRNALLVISEMRHGVQIADEQGDPGTVDVFSRLVQIHEKHEWWLRDMLESDDGFHG